MPARSPLTRLADRYAWPLTRLSRLQRTRYRAMIPFLAVAVVLCAVSRFVIVSGARVGLSLFETLPPVTVLYVLALASCLLGDAMKGEWRAQWGPEDFPERFDRFGFDRLVAPNRARYVTDGAAIVVRIREATRETKRFEVVDGE